MEEFIDFLCVSTLERAETIADKVARILFSRIKDAFREDIVSGLLAEDGNSEAEASVKRKNESITSRSSKNSRRGSK